MDLPTSASNVPGVSELRQRLNYGDDRGSFYKIFSGDVRAFLPRYLSTSKAQCSDIIVWRNPEHRAKLFELTAFWLDQQGGGLNYWPSDPFHTNFNTLQYEVHREHIFSTMVQLFFKINIIANQNRKSKNQHRWQTHESSPGRSSNKDATDAERSREPQAAVISEASQGSTIASEPYYTDNIDLQRDRTLDEHHDDATAHHVTGTNTQSNAPRDVYTVPTSPEPTTKKPRKTRIVVLHPASKRRAITSSRQEQSVASHAQSDTPTEDSSTKRRRQNDKEPDAVTQHQPKRRRQDDTSQTENQPILPQLQPHSTLLSKSYLDGVNGLATSFSTPQSTEAVTSVIESTQPVERLPTDTSDQPPSSTLNIDQSQLNTSTAHWESMNVNVGLDTTIPSTNSHSVEPVSSIRATVETNISTSTPQYTSQMSQELASPTLTYISRSTSQSSSADEPTIVDIVDADGTRLGGIRKIDLSNERIDAILSMTIQRPVEIRAGRKFNEVHIAGIYDRPEFKGLKWLSCLIQAIGVIQKQACACCKKKLGPFAKCTIIGDSMFPKCGNCEWNRHQCSVAAGKKQPKPSTEKSDGISAKRRRDAVTTRSVKATSMASVPNKTTQGKKQSLNKNTTKTVETSSTDRPTLTSSDVSKPSTHDKTRSNNQSLNPRRAQVHDEVEIFDEMPLPSTASTTAKTAEAVNPRRAQVHDEVEIFDEMPLPSTASTTAKTAEAVNPRRGQVRDEVEIHDEIPLPNTVSATVKAAEVSTPSQENPTTNNKPEVQATPGNQPFTMVYFVILSRKPALDIISWKPKGLFRLKTLPEFIQEVPLKLGAGSKGFLFSLTGPLASLRMTVMPGQVAEFEYFKKTIATIVRNSVQENTHSEHQLVFTLEIEERLDDELAPKKNEEKEDVNLDF